MNRLESVYTHEMIILSVISYFSDPRLLPSTLDLRPSTLDQKLGRCNTILFTVGSTTLFTPAKFRRLRESIFTIDSERKVNANLTMSLF